MTGEELARLLERADRNPNWLAKQLGRTRTTVLRWKEHGVPAEHADRVQALLPALDASRAVPSAGAGREATEAHKDAQTGRERKGTS
jgi:hypothetical protein